MTSGVCREGEYREVVYSRDRWELLRRMRERAAEIMRPFTRYGFRPYAYGSLARGDVKETSDIDITFLTVVDPSLIEHILASEGFSIEAKYIVMATPTYTPKAYIWLDAEGREQVSFFIAEPRPTSIDFYRFGGLIDYPGLERGNRVPGVDKRLMLIQPTETGHVESCIIGREGEVARLLGVAQEVVMERVRKLTRRSRVGRTGVYLEYRLAPGESIAEAISHLKRVNKYFRWQVEGRSAVT
ncbi:DNA polymerase subunit beta [Candidatus Geothermarchaeota archaeon ex4572_27]|nr:MAG: DNA polymerase subunit beta [Candidatus Geothermarchaeota archaeon ex4572_27]